MTETEINKRAWLCGAAKALGLVKRVPEFMRRRGWPYQDESLVAVIIAAIACKVVLAAPKGRPVGNAADTKFRRPAAADGLSGLWPADKPVVTAAQIVDTLELDELLKAA